MKTQVYVPVDSVHLADKLTHESLQVSLPELTLLNSPVSIVSHQTRAMTFKLQFSGRAPTQFSLRIGYTTGPHGLVRTVEVVVGLKHRSISEAQKVTFLHPSGTVSYAVLRPPLNITCSTSGKRDLPLLLGLHGAGIEADGDLVRHMLDGVYGICAWILFPTGVTSWSGDDWRAYFSFSNIEISE